MEKGEFLDISILIAVFLLAIMTAVFVIHRVFSGEPTDCSEKAQAERQQRMVVFNICANKLNCEITQRGIRYNLVDARDYEYCEENHDR